MKLDGQFSMTGHRIIGAFCAILALSACGDPLDKLPKLSELNVSETTPSVDALSQADTTPAGEGLFQSLWKKPDPTPVTADTAETVTNEDIETSASVDGDAISDTPISETVLDPTIVAEKAPERAEKPQGFLSRIGAALSAPQEVQSSVQDSVETGVLEGEEKTDLVEIITTNVEPDPDVVVAEEPEIEPERSGFWPFGARANRSDETPQGETVQLASASAVPAPRRGWFTPKVEKRTGPDAQLVSYGETLPYGKIATVCDVSPAQLGKKVDQYPARGKGYTLYDSNPTAEGLRTHYLTGFKDGCARQFTSALALFGSVETHQTVRYKKSNSDLPYSNSDTAFENVKSNVCKVGKGTPCSENGTAKLDKNMVFVSVYERFGTNPRWADILLYKGTVLAKDFKGR